MYFVMYSMTSSFVKVALKSMFDSMAINERGTKLLMKWRQLERMTQMRTLEEGASLGDRRLGIEIQSSGQCAAEQRLLLFSF
jgi:hypothetical protein|tara:strand:- start:118 stop:363 length:246 start_codon:yes stop_codon:yes gene_type:complete